MVMVMVILIFSGAGGAAEAQGAGRGHVKRLRPKTPWGACNSNVARALLVRLLLIRCLLLLLLRLLLLVRDVQLDLLIVGGDVLLVELQEDKANGIQDEK